MIFTSGSTALATQSAQADEAGWITYTSPQLHISFAHPHHWKVVAPDWKPSPGDTPVITLYPPADDPLSGNKVDMAYLAFEIADRQSLQTWSRMYELAAHGGPLPEITVIRSQTLVQPDGSEQRVLHTAGVGESGPFQTVQLTHGRLVLSISAYTHGDVMTEVLEKIATSIEFTPDAPKTLNELYGTDREWPSLEEVLEQNRRDAISAPFCDIVCRDAEASKHITPVPPPTPSPEFLEQERKWREWLEQQNGSGSVTGGVAPMGTPEDNRKALPSNWWSPIPVTSGSKSVDCSSPWHTGRATFAVDIRQVYTGTAVYAAQAGIVMFAGWDNSGYGKLMRIAIDNVIVADENRKYWHNYAHLSAFWKTAGSSVYRGERIADVGSTGNSTGPHLHFHVTLDVNKNDVGQLPVDLSPMSGFTPNLSYPTTGTCGQIKSRANSPIIIEPVMFTQRYQPRDDHYWFCYTNLNRTTECFMHGVPNNGAGWDPLVTWQSPELRYNNVYVPASGTYYIWVCGRGGSYDDDSLHMGYNDAVYSTSDRISGYHNNYWVWESVTMDWENGHWQRPTLWMSGGDRTTNVWMREDGMRIDRMLLTRSSGYNPSDNIRCGGY